MPSSDLSYYLGVIRRRLPAGLLLALAIASATITISLLLPPMYRATVKILIEPPQIPEVLARSTVATGGLEQVQIIEQQMMTGPTLLDIAQRFQIYGDRPNLSQNDIVASMRSRTKFTARPLAGAGAGGATVVDLSYDSPKPQLSAQVAGGMAERIINENSTQRVGQAGDTLDFFQQEVTRLGNELKALEGQLLRFKFANRDALPDSLEFRRNQQSAQQERLTQLEREEAELRDRRATLIKTFTDYNDVAGSPQPTTPAEQTLANLKRTLVEQQLIYSDDSPTITLLKSQIAKLTEQVKAERAALTATTANGGPPSTYQVQMAEIDGRLNFIATEREAINKSLAALTQSIDATPANEVTLNAMQRNIQNIQAQYNAATAKLADASTGQQIELRSKGVNFSIMDQPRVPPDPTSSKRLLIAAAGVIAGLIAGLGLIFLLEYTAKGIKRPADLANSLQIMPFGTVPYIYAPNERALRKTAIATAMAVALFGVPLMIVTLNSAVIPIDILMLKFSRQTGP